MNGPARAIAIAAAILGFTAVLLAALGSHLVDFESQPDLQHIWQTASIIHLFHAAALTGLAAILMTVNLRTLQVGAWLLVTGVVLFCGSLYLRAITGSSSTALAPLGGVLMMAGWLVFALAFFKGVRLNKSKV